MDKYASIDLFALNECKYYPNHYPPSDTRFIRKHLTGKIIVFFTNICKVFYKFLYIFHN